MGTAPGSGRRQFLISKAWIQAVVLVVLCGFFVLGLLAYRTYQAHPPVPARVLDQNGRVLFTGKDIRRGQQVFLHNGLMEYGSAFGHGAYLGPDYTADYLRRASNLVRDSYGGPASDAAARKTIEDMRANRYEAKTGTLPFSAAQAAAFRRLVPYYRRFFSDPKSEHGLRPGAIRDATQLRELTSFFAWTAWAAAANRPGHRYSYTNNWPSEPRVGNEPDGERDRLVGAVAGRPARRRRAPVRGVRPLGPPPRLARPRAGEVVVSRSRRRRADAGPASDRLVLLRDGGSVPDPDARRRRIAALPRRDRQLLRLRPRPLLPVQPDAYLARPAGDLLGRDLVCRRRHLPRADDRATRAEAPGQARLRASRCAGGRRLRDAGRLLPRGPRRAPERGVELVRPAGVRVPRPRPPVADPALRGTHRVGVHALAGAAAGGLRRSTLATCRGCFSPPLARSRPSTPSA